MSQIESNQARSERAESTSTPAIGLVVDQGTGDGTAAQILRAYRRGHDVLVTPGSVGNEESEGLAFARQLDAKIVPVDDREPRERLADVARETGYPGIVIHLKSAEPLQFEQSLHALRETNSYVADAVTDAHLDVGPSVLVAIPAYNEAETIGDVVTDAQAHADVVLVIDDGSDDGTEEKARAAGATVVRHEENRGYGVTLQTAFKEADRCRAEHLVILDGDGQHDPADIPRFIETHETGVNIAVGCRFGKKTETETSLYRRFGISVTNILTNISMGRFRSRSRIRDTQCGFRSYDRTAIESLAEAGRLDDNMGASTDILHHAQLKDLEITEVQTTVDYSVGNANSYNSLHHGVILLVNLLRTIERERPLAFLMIPGYMVVFAGVGLGYWSVQNFLQTDTTPLGMALISALLMIVGTFAVFTGIILHAMKTYFE